MSLPRAGSPPSRAGPMDDDIVNFRPLSNHDHSLFSPANQSTLSSLRRQLKWKKSQSPLNSPPPKVTTATQDISPQHHHQQDQEAAAESGDRDVVGKAVGRPAEIGDPCPDHPDKRCNLWCIEDNMLVCYRCYIFGPNHKGHTLVEEKARYLYTQTNFCFQK